MQTMAKIIALGGLLAWFRKKYGKTNTEKTLTIPVQLPAKQKPTNSTTGSTVKSSPVGTTPVPTPPPADPVTILPAGTVNTAYAYPSLNTGVVKYAANGAVIATYLKLNYYEQDGQKFIKDTAPDDFYWDDNGGYTGQVEKRYYIGLGSDNFYTAAEMQAGVNVSAYAGAEITVFCGYIAVANDLSVTWKEQTIYIPSSPDTLTISGGTYAFYYTGRPFNNAKHLRFANYITAAGLQKPAGHRIVIDTYTEAERNSGTTYQAAGVSSKYATDSNFKSLYIGDDWLFKPQSQGGLGHPQAYVSSPQQWQEWFNNFIAVNGGMDGAKNALKQHFQNTIINPNNAPFVFLNNELYGFWNETFSAWIGECYDLWKQQRSGILAAYGNRLFKFDMRTPNKNAAWSDYNFAGNYAQFAATQGQYVQAVSPNSVSYKLHNCSLNMYFTNPWDSGTIYTTILAAAMGKKFNVEHKLLVETWRTSETYPNTHRLGKAYAMHNGRAIEAFVKPTVSPHLMRNIGAVSAYCADITVAWDDGFAVAENAAALYPNDARFLDNGQNVQAAAVQDTVVQTSNLDSLLDGLYSVFRFPEFNGLNFAFADVKDGANWRTNAESFVAGAWQDRKPLALYKRSGNSFLILAYAQYNKGIQDVTIRVKDASGNFVEKTVRLFADRVSVVKF